MGNKLKQLQLTYTSNFSTLKQELLLTSTPTAVKHAIASIICQTYVDFDALVWQMMPVRLRNSVHYAWLKCLIKPVKALFDLFAVNRNKNLYTLAHNSQVVFMEAALNDTFDPVNRGIHITDGPFKDPLYTYLTPETKPLWLGLTSEIGSTSYPDPQVLFTEGETALLGVGFLVMVPVAVTFDTERMKALINLYRLAGRNRYDMVIY